MQQNNDSSGMIFVMAVVGAAAFFMFAFVFALAVFLSIILTGFAIAAWNKPVTLFGETTTPEEARDFVRRGLLGAILVPCFALFASGLFGVHIRPDYWIHLPLGGYAFGSLGIGIWMAQNQQQKAAQAAQMQALLPPEKCAHPVQTIEATPVQPTQAQSQPFRFATWDDEEELRK